MKKKTQPQQQLHISSFIKEPASLKLLILAGTNIRPSELPTISKCTGLIKLDLSGNFLADLPLKLSTFACMKILYLHDNQLTSADIRNTHLEYISLFKNPIQPSEYRQALIQSNPALMGIDFNIVTARQKYAQDLEKLPTYSEIKWPIVEVSAGLEHEDDYLNLLKAEIFVVNNVYQRTCRIEDIEKVLQTAVTIRRYKIQAHKNPVHSRLITTVLRVVSKWKRYTRLRRKLRAILAAKGKERLCWTTLERRKAQRSEGLNKVMASYLAIVRKKMKLRAPFQRQLKSYVHFIPAQKDLELNFLGITSHRDYKNTPFKFYFRQSELDTISKVCLYAKKLFFKERDYDLCDQFNNLFCETPKKYEIHRKRSYETSEYSWFKNSIHSSQYILKEITPNRSWLLYTKKGHRQIKVKSVVRPRPLSQAQLQKVQAADRRLKHLYEKYDKLLEYNVKSYKILKTVLKIMRFLNAGNGGSIVTTETAYFQTEVITAQNESEEPKDKSQHKICIGLEFFIRRVAAANAIQRCWRRRRAAKQSINIIEQIRKKRATALISKWLREIIFLHRQSSLKFRSYLRSIQRATELYMQLDVYLNLPKPTNFLRFAQYPEDSQALYVALHKGTRVSLVKLHGRRWVKIVYGSCSEAVEAQILLHKFTYRYADSFYLRLFTQNQLRNASMLAQYEQRVRNLFKIGVQVGGENQTNTPKVIPIENPEPCFLWSEVNSLQHFDRFAHLQRHNTNVSIFIYNKHKRPLKVSCQFYWVLQHSLYQSKSLKMPGNANQSPRKSQQLQLETSTNAFNQKVNLFDIEYTMNLRANSRKPKYFIDLPKMTPLDRAKANSSKKHSLESHQSSLTKSHRSRIVSDKKFEKLAETLNIRGK